MLFYRLQFHLLAYGLNASGDPLCKLGISQVYIRLQIVAA